MRVNGQKCACCATPCLHTVTIVCVHCSAAQCIGHNSICTRRLARCTISGCMLHPAVPQPPKATTDHDYDRVWARKAGILQHIVTKQIRMLIIWKVRCCLTMLPSTVLKTHTSVSIARVMVCSRSFSALKATIRRSSDTVLLLSTPFALSTFCNRERQEVSVRAQHTLTHPPTHPPT